MAGLISNSEKIVLTGIFDQIFITFSRDITIFKESQKISINPLPTNIFGFGDSQANDSYTYSQISGVFPAVIRYKEQIVNLGYEINTYIDDGDVSIKVRKDCRDFINSGKTDKIVFDDKQFILNAEERKQNFLDSNFWVFKLKTVK